MNAQKIYGENVYVNLDEVIETVYQCRADVADREWETRWLEPLLNLSRIEVKVPADGIMQYRNCDRYAVVNDKGDKEYNCIGCKKMYCPFE